MISAQKYIISDNCFDINNFYVINNYINRQQIFVNRQLIFDQHLNNAMSIPPYNILLKKDPLHIYNIDLTTAGVVTKSYVNQNLTIIYDNDAGWSMYNLDISAYLGKYIKVTGSDIANSGVSNIVIYNNKNIPLAHLSTIYNDGHIYIPLNAAYAKISFKTNCNVYVYDIDYNNNLSDSIRLINDFIKCPVFKTKNVQNEILENFIQGLYIPNQELYSFGVKICVVARNYNSMWRIALYVNTSEIGGTGDLVFDYTVTENPEGETGLQLISKNGIYIIVDWTKLNDGFYGNSMVDPIFILSNYCYNPLSYSKIFSIIKDNGNYNIEWNLPSKITTNTSYFFTYFENTLIKNYEYFNAQGLILRVETDCSTKYIYKSTGQIKTDGTYIKFSAYKCFNDGTLVAISSHILNLHTHNVIQKTINCLILGDSYCDNLYGTKGMIGWIQQLAQDQGCTIVSKGTRLTEYNISAEAYQGWNEENYFRYISTSSRDNQNTRNPANVSSPFMFSQDDTVANAKFNFHDYLNVNNIGQIDAIVIFLGMNGGDGNYINKMINGDNNNIVASSIRDVLPNIPILINFVPNYWGCDNFSDFDAMIGQNNRISQNLGYTSIFDKQNNIFLIPASAYNRVFGFRCIGGASIFSQLQGNLQYDVQLPTTIFNYDHHPSTFGVKILANNIVGSLI